MSGGRAASALHRLSAMGGNPRTGRAARWLGSALGWLALWIVLAEGELAKLPGLALGVVAAATASSELVGPRREWRVRPLGALRFAAHFARVSVIGGADVARRALGRKLDIKPEVLEVTVESEPGSPILAFLVGAVSLVPGTLCADARGRRLTVHVVDRTRDNERRVRELEARIAGAVAAPRREGG